MEAEARRRLGRFLEASDEVIENAIAVRMPEALRHSGSCLVDSIAEARFEYCLFSLGGEELHPDEVTRFPTSGWLAGDALGGSGQRASGRYRFARSDRRGRRDVTLRNGKDHDGGKRRCRGGQSYEVGGWMLTHYSKDPGKISVHGNKGRLS